MDMFLIKNIWIGPNEKTGYIVCNPIPDLNQPNPVATACGVGFYRSLGLTDQSFIDMVNSLPQRSGETKFTTVNECTAWLTSSGLWTSYGL